MVVAVVDFDLRRIACGGFALRLLDWRGGGDVLHLVAQFRIGFASAIGRNPIRYVAAFDSLAIALMHAQTALRRCLIDVEAGLYRTDPLTAVAAVDAIDLRHQVRYLDPELAADPRLSVLTGQRRARRRRIDRVWTAVGILAILLLLLLGQIPSG